MQIDSTSSLAGVHKTAEEILGAVGRVQQRTKNQNDYLSVTWVPEMTKSVSCMFPVECNWDTNVHVDCTLFFKLSLLTSWLIFNRFQINQLMPCEFFIMDI